MDNTLVDMMAGFIDLSNAEKQGIRDAFPIRTYAKETVLLKEGQVAQDAFFVIKGCIRAYYMYDGVEKTSGFYTEFQSAVNFDSMANSQPSRYYFTCAEETVVAIINAQKETDLYKKFPRFGEVCRVEMEKMLGASHEHLADFINSTPQERYLHILKERPSLIHRVPQYQLASYLGMQPETLSRIRKRISHAG